MVEPSAPATRKRGAVGDTTGSAQPPKALVLLRVKRRRTDAPVARLLVPREAQELQEKLKPEIPQSEAENAAPGAHGELLQAFTKLSTGEKQPSTGETAAFVFTRIDTVENRAEGDAKWAERLRRKARSLKDEREQLRTKARASPFLQDATRLRSSSAAAQQAQKQQRERRKSEVQRSRGLDQADKVEIKQQSTLELRGIRVVDLEAVRVNRKDEADAEGEEKQAEVTVNGARLRPTRVLNPAERELDEAIWAAFQRNDFSRFFSILNSQRPEIRTSPAMFQRPADGGSVLMAAGLHGRADVIEALLRHSPASVLLRDWEDNTASAFARRGGHSSVEKALLACEEAENDKDFVYDVYCVDVSHGGANPSSGISAAATGSDASMIDSSAPVVTVSSAVQQWLSQDAHAPTDEVEEYMLESDHGSHDGSDEYDHIYRYGYER